MNVKYRRCIIVIVIFLLVVSCKKETANNIVSDEKESITVIHNPKSRDNFDKDYYYSTIIFNTNIRNTENGSSNILLKTEAGCSLTGFSIKDDYFLETKNINRIYIASTMEELIRIQDSFIYLPYWETFSDDYFENNHLVFVITGYGGSGDLRNERIEQINGKYSFNIEHWFRGNEGEGPIFPYCGYTALYILEIPKT
ncbi:MAG: hypothetical protein LBI28_08295 [Treponema sp.]|jgi:hypothetical protein|nr:hypothetical protein [Treponema sp.]